MADVSNLKIVLEDRVSKGLGGIDSNLDRVDASAKKTQRSLDRMAAASHKSFGGISMAGGLAAGAIAGVGVAIVAGLKAVIDINSEYQKLQANLVTVSGSTEKAAAQFKALQQFAAKTPFALGEVTKAFTAMQAYGLSTSEATLTAFGNIAGGMGKSIQDVVEATADAANGEFERLKAFSIKATKQGDNIAFRFKGVTTTVKNNAADIQSYIEGIGNKDFAGGMARQAATIDGAWSNLTDSIKNSIAELGSNSGFNEFISNIINGATNGIETIKTFFAALSDNAALQSIQATVQGIIKSFNDFMNSTVQIAGVTSTVWGQIGGFVMDAIDVIAQAVDMGIKAVMTFVDATADALGEYVQMWQSFFNTGIGKFTAKFLIGLVNAIEAAVKIAVKLLLTIPTAIMQAFGATSKIVGSFFQRLDSLMKGNLGAFNGFWDEAAKAAKKPFDTIAGMAKDTGGIIDGFVKDTNAGVLTAGKELDNLHKKNMANIAKAQKARSAKPNVDMSALNTSPTGGPAAPTVDKEALKKAEQELKEFENRVKSLTDTYAPAIDRQNKWKQASEDFTRLLGLGEKGLEKYGLTVEKVKEMMEDARATMKKGFFENSMEGLEFEQATIAATEFSDVASVVAEKLRQIGKAAKDAHEKLTPAQEAALAAQIKTNEELERSIALRKKVADANADLMKDTAMRVQDLEDEASLLGKVGKERERASDLLYARRDAERSGADIEHQTASIKAYTAALDALEAKRASLNTFGQGLKEAMSKYAEAAQDIAAQTAEGMGNVFGSLEDSLADFIKTGHLSMKGFLKTIADELAAFAAKQAVLGFLKIFGLISGGGLGGFGGFFAAGGNPPVGKTSIVGENGPELFVPRQSGTIIPNSMLNVPQVASGGKSISINLSMPINIEGGNYDQGTMEDWGAQITDNVLRNMTDQLRHNGFLSGR
jgi:lambda family phage tail tape measure protein